MKTVAAAIVALVLAVSDAGAAAARLGGTLPSELAQGESVEALGNRIADAIAPVDEVIVPDCASRAYTLKGVSTVNANDPMLVELSKGKRIWHVMVEATGCGARRTHNVYLFEQPGGPLRLIATLPGETAASFKLQLDVLQVLAPAANGMGPKDCKQRAIVIDTKIVDAPSGRLPWSESWKFRACGTDISFRVTFTFDATGVGFGARKE